MNPTRVALDDFGVASAALPGPLVPKLQALAQAGFGQVQLWAADLSQHPQGVDAAVAQVHASGLRVSALWALDDWEGVSGPLQAYKRGVAQALLALCQALGCRMLVVRASTLPDTGQTARLQAQRLRQLAMLAIPKGIRIAYLAQPTARWVTDFTQAWDLVCLADMPNLGLCLDLADALSLPQPQDDLDLLDPGKLFLVALADPWLAKPGVRLFPGEGEHRAPLAQAVSCLHALGYRGDYVLWAAGADDLQTPAEAVVQRAWTAALWLGQEVLQRSLPLPNQIRLKRGRAG